MKSRKRDSNINGRGIRRGCEAAMVKQENFYFREFDNSAIALGVRRISCIAESKPRLRSNLFVPNSVISRLNVFTETYLKDSLLTKKVSTFIREPKITEEILRRNGEKIWASKSQMHSTLYALQLPNIDERVSFDVRMNNITHPSSLQSATPGKGTPVKALNTNEKKASTANFKSTAEKLKAILKVAIASTEIIYVQADEVNFDDRSVSSNEDTKAEPQKGMIPSTGAEESYSSQNSSSNSYTACRTSELPFNKTATDPSAPDDINDAVSIEESPEGDDYEKYVDDKDERSGNTKSSKEETQTQNKDDTKEEATTVEIEDVSAVLTREETDHDKGSNVLDGIICGPLKRDADNVGSETINVTKKKHAHNQAVTAHVTASRMESQHNISRYNFNRVGVDLSKLLNPTSTDVEIPVDFCLNLENSQDPLKKDYNHSSEKSKVSIQGINKSAETVGSHKTVTIQNSAETLELSSQYLINEVFTVNSSNTLDVLKKLGVSSRNTADSAKHLGVRYDVFNDGILKGNNKLIAKKKCTELQRSDTHDEFLDALQEKRNMKYKKGLKLTVNKGETQTRLCFNDIASPKVPKVCSARTDIKSTPDKLQRFTIEDSSTAKSFDSSSLCRGDGIGNWLLDEMQDSKYSREAKTNSKTLSNMFVNSYLKRSSKEMEPTIWRRKKSKTHDANSSTKRSLSDTNSIHSCLGRKYSKSSTYESSDDLDRVSINSWESGRIETHIYDRDMKRSSDYDRDVKSFGDYRRLDNPEPYRKVSQTEDDILQMANDKLSKHSSETHYRSNFHFREPSIEMYYS